ncbi:MAG: L,D-transpeptidase [Phenylobacterium sp.]|uniref:L,D-transpeptidase family protein n=1 Tax=Phenylobacterium sp. TaxID=1871053 RepID=UPI00391DC49F
MIFTAMSDGRFDLAGRITRCALGRGGVIAAEDKREGDGCTPLGTWTIRRILFRPDKGGRPDTGLPTKALERDDGWCDDPDDPAYNRPVKLPHPARAEAMWREDELYDLVGVLAHNDDPPVPGLGSCIFLHLAKPDYAPTEGCIALSREDMISLLAMAKHGDAVAVVRA